MKIAIIGGSGFIGRNLAQELQKQNHEIYIFSRQDRLPSSLVGFEKIHLITCSKPLANDLNGLDGIINLAGEAVVGGRWTENRKVSLRSSRVDLTVSLISELEKCKVKPKFLMQGSAIGFYGMYESGMPVFSEDGKSGDDFLARLCVDWENSSIKARDMGIRTVLLRTGVVLSPESGALQQMLTPFKLFAGGPLGSGKQFMSWIHIKDMVNAILFLVNDAKLEGAFNLTAPNPCSNEEFSTILGSILQRPSFMRAPSFAINALFGEGADVILKGQNVVPTKLMKSKFQFQFPDLRLALTDLLIS